MMPALVRLGVPGFVERAGIMTAAGDDRTEPFWVTVFIHEAPYFGAGSERGILMIPDPNRLPAEV